MEVETTPKGCSETEGTKCHRKLGVACEAGSSGFRLINSWHGGSIPKACLREVETTPKRWLGTEGTNIIASLGLLEKLVPMASSLINSWCGGSIPKDASGKATIGALGEITELFPVFTAGGTRLA
ncbi:hypothetical protein L3X38_018794 [Prunus dulcis]|uniref:Uncharacterized protein n=1 Tax=Prunus dulcis TaxID=3755 RepID=A0AAD4WBX9_PRUDU|nr:hypothetical protein L3X38_018794 [Prunus dulcis]